MEMRAGYTTSGWYQCLEDLQRDYVDMYLSYCGMEICSPGHSFGPCKRTEYVLHVITKGKGIFKSIGRTWNLRENDAFLLIPDTETYYEADKEEPWNYIWVGFNGIRAYECISSAGFSRENPVTTFKCTSVLADCVNQMLNDHQLTYYNELRRESQLLRLMAVMVEEKYSETRKDDGKYDYAGSVYVKHAIEYMRYHYSKKIKINDLAEYIGINRGYLTDSFKKTVNMSPQEFLLNLRMSKAASLLQKTALPINAVAIQVGYDDPLAFSKRFKQKYSVSPKAFRETQPELIMAHEKEEYDRQMPL